MIVDVAVDNHEAQSIGMGEVLDSTVNVLGVKEVVAEAVRLRASAQHVEGETGSGRRTKGRGRPRWRRLDNRL